MPDVMIRRKEIRPQDGFQSQFLASKADITIGGAMAGVGKRLHVDTLIPTPDGFKRNGDLVAGDIIFNEKGEQIIVLIAHPIIKCSGYIFVFDDGSNVISCEDHLWQTYTAADLDRMTRNLQPRKEIKTSKQIYNTLYRGEHSNHAIKVCDPIITEEFETDVDPYLFGLWLGDAGERDYNITTADLEVLQSFEKGGFKTTKWSGEYSYGLKGFRQLLNKNGINSKKIPKQFLRASIEQRISLIQGLMDSDGSSGDRNEFCSTNKQLAKDFAELIRSLGIKCSIKESDAKIYGKICGKRYRISFTTNLRLFRLYRKDIGQKYSSRRVNSFRYIKECFPISDMEMKCITVSDISGLYLCTENFITTHNSWCLQVAPLRHKDVDGFNCICFRRTTEQIRNPGGLWDKSVELYPLFGLKPSEQQLEWHNYKKTVTFKLAGLQHEKNIYDHDGPEYCLIEWDELQHFTKKQFFYLGSRNRSTCGVRPYVLATCNPDPDSWLAEFLEWWIDQDEKLSNGDNNPDWGYPIKERIGILRYLYIYEDKYIWDRSKEDLVLNNPEIFAENNPDINPHDLIKSITLITGSIFDNHELLDKNPGYLANLTALDESEKLRLFYGNWKVRGKDNCIHASLAIINSFDNPTPTLNNISYITCDAARFGEDLCTIWTWRGWKVVFLDVLTKSSQDDIVKRIEKRRTQFGVLKSNVIIDQDGVGGGVVKVGKYKGYSGADKALPVYELMVSGKPKSENYFNLNTQLAYRFAEKLNDNEISFDLNEGNVYIDDYHGLKIKIKGTMHDVRDLIKADLRAIRIKDIDGEGKKRINSKTEQKQLLRRSPDFYDGAKMRAIYDLKNSKIVTGTVVKGKSGSLLDRL